MNKQFLLFTALIQYVMHTHCCDKETLLW